MELLFCPPLVNKRAQRWKPGCIQFGPLRAGQPNRPLDKFFFWRHWWSADALFCVFHRRIMRDSNIDNIVFLNHNKDMKQTCGIYKITSPTGSVYIGQSTNIEKRFKDYRSHTSCSRQVRLYASFLKHGAKKHTFEIVECCHAAELNERERHWQDALDVTGDSGLNCRLTAASDRTGLHSEASKSLMRQKQSGANNPNYGKRGAETSTFGRKRTNEEREAIKAYQSTRGRIVQQFDLNGVLVREARIRDFAAQGHSQGNISWCCLGKAKTHHGYIFKYKDQP